MAGQKDYYVTHQCFISPNALYLVVWNMTLQVEGVMNLRPWLLNIQVSWSSFKPLVTSYS